MMLGSTAVRFFLKIVSVAFISCFTGMAQKKGERLSSMGGNSLTYILMCIYSSFFFVAFPIFYLSRLYCTMHNAIFNITGFTWFKYFHRNVYFFLDFSALSTGKYCKKKSVTSSSKNIY